MSGIAGVFHLDGRPVQRQHLAHMTQLLAHRGPDDRAIWLDGGVGLGHCLLHTTRESLNEHQPLTSNAGRFTITANARLDNRHDLLGRLGWRDRPAEALSDSALLLGAYQRWGARCVEHILGDFAFALWDARRHALFCARDHLGLRPFYYFHSEAVFAFASEIKALLALAEVPRHLNETRVADFLMQMTQDQEATFYDGIRRLPPAHTMTVTPEQVRLDRYWALDPHREIRLPSDEAYAEAYRAHFVEAVRCRLRSAFPVGSLLSGGLDSSSVTCVARTLLGATEAHPLDTFSLLFKQVPESDERPFIEAVVEQGGLRPHYVRGDRFHPFDDLDRLLWHLDEPFFTPNLFLNGRLWEAGRARGVRVMLDGFLGDNVVSHGSRYLTELAAAGRWLALAREVRAVAARQRTPWRAAARLVKRFALVPLVAEPLRRAWHGLTRPALPPCRAHRFIHPDLARRVGWMERARAFGEAVPRTPRSAREEHYRELTSGILPGALEIANKAAAAFAVEPCYPFADRRLMEFCLAVPARQKCQGGWTRVIARGGVGPYLPEPIRTRWSKADLSPNLHRSLLVLAQEEMSAFIFERLPRAAPYVDVGALQQAYRQLLPSQRRPLRRQDATILSLWLATVLTRWLELEESVVGPRWRAGSLAVPGESLRMQS